jgi:hypothetical protein
MFAIVVIPAFLVERINDSEETGVGFLLNILTAIVGFAALVFYIIYFIYWAINNITIVF